MNKRFTGIDIIKILATVLVVFYHYAYPKLNFGYNTDTNHFNPTLEWGLMNIASICVPLFFMCSGYCNLSSDSFSWSKAFRKTASIVMLTCIWNYLLPFEYWFFITLALLYLCTPLLKYIKSKNNATYYVIVAIVFVATFVKNEFYVILCACNISSNIALSGLFTSYALIYYVLGDEAKRIHLHKITLLVIFTAGFALSWHDGIILTLYHGRIFDGVNSAFCMLSALLMTWSIFMLIKDFVTPSSQLARSLCLIASGCLPVYIFHSALIRWINEQNYSFFDTSIIFFLLIEAIFVCTICWYFGRLLSSLPYIKKLLKL